MVCVTCNLFYFVLLLRIFLCLYYLIWLTSVALDFLLCSLVCYFIVTAPASVEILLPNQHIALRFSKFLPLCQDPRFPHWQQRS